VNHKINHGVTCACVASLVVVVISRVWPDLLVCGVPTTFYCRSVIYYPVGS
jgi:hypothetical protein